MNRIIYLSFIIWHLSFGSAAAQNDTLVINNPRKVTIISSDSLQRVIVNGKQGDDDFTYQNTIRLVDANYESNTSISRDHRVGHRNRDRIAARIAASRPF